MKRKYYDFIGFEECNLYGVKHPVLILRGTLNNGYRLVIKIDGKEASYKNLFNEKKKFYIEKELGNKDKNIEILVQNQKEVYIIKRLKNTVLKRVRKKIGLFVSPIKRKIEYLGETIVKGVRIAWREHHFLIPPALWPKYAKALIYKLRGGEEALYYNPFDAVQYNKWLDIQKKDDIIEEFSYNPLISIIIPVYNIERKFLTDCLDSILNQTYKNFEVCLADDCSTKEETVQTLKEYEQKDKRIRVTYRKTNGHISKATNTAIEMAKGEFIALMDDDDVLTENALYENVKALNKNKNLDLLYSDEDKMEMDGTFCDPHFKPDFSYDTLLGGNYICHFSVFRKSIIDEIGGFRDEYVGAQDFDLVLRFTEKTDNIYHIRKVLYHWRKVPGSTATTIDSKSYAIENGKKAIEDALKRRNVKGHVNVPINAAHYVVEYDYDKEPKISIIIPTKDYADILENCLKSIYEKTNYDNYEVIVVNNQSVLDETYVLFDKYKKERKNFKVIDADFEFNYSKLNNLAVNESTGDYVVLLNNDTEVISKDWLKIMVGYAMQDHIGAVGPKLLYPDMTIQHGGVILGIGDIASHAYVEVEKSNFGTFGRLLIPYNYSAVTGACLMVKKSKYLEVGGLNEDLKVAYNDVDFCLELLEKGYYNLFVSQVELIHYESKTRGLDTTTRKYKRFLLEIDYMRNKWGDKLAIDRFYNPNYSRKKNFRLDKKK